MQLVVITPPALSLGEPRVVNSLCAAGCTALHVRKPGASAAELREYVQAVAPAFHCRLVLHSHHALAEELGLKGIHFRERDRPAPPLRRGAAGRSQSTSLHSLADVARPDWGALDYAFLSPVFDSISKAGYAAAGFERGALAAALARAPMPVLALGGVTPARLPELRELGFAGAGVLGAVWGADDPVSAFAAFLRAAEAPP
ncbi:thiE [Scenedesmus sp. PABB004]|nr:thiE [Scenedesmus sp. PABB004]